MDWPEANESKNPNNNLLASSDARGKFTGGEVRLAARGFKQEDGVNYSKDDKSSPVINDMSTTICLY